MTNKTSSCLNNSGVSHFHIILYTSLCIYNTIPKQYSFLYLSDMIQFRIQLESSVAIIFYYLLHFFCHFACKCLGKKSIWEGQVDWICCRVLGPPSIPSGWLPLHRMGEEKLLCVFVGFWKVHVWKGISLSVFLARVIGQSKLEAREE